MLSGLLGGKAGGAYNRKVRVGRRQGTTWSGKRLFATWLPSLSRGDPFGWFAAATCRTAPPNRLEEALTQQDLGKSPLQLTATPLGLFVGIRGAFCLLKHTPGAFEKQPCQFSLLCIIPRGGEISQTPASSAASQRHGSHLASSGTPLPHQARSHRLWEPDIPLPFHTPPPYLPQLL